MKTSRSLWLSLSFIVVTAIRFSLWMKRCQLEIYSKQLPDAYPLTGWILPAAIAVGFFLSFWVISAWLARLVFRFYSPETILKRLSFSYLWLLLVPQGLPLHWGLKGFLATHLLFGIGYSLANLRKRSIQMSFRHLGVLLLILFTQFSFNDFMSPRQWDNPIAALRETESGQTGMNTPLHRSNYAEAKAYGFSPFMHSYWGAVSHGPNMGYSFGISFLTLLGDLPAIDATAFYRCVMFLFFSWCVLGSFAFYLYCFYGLRLSFATSAFGGTLFVLANTFFAQGLTDFLPLFSGVYLTIPASLLMLRLAFRKKRPELAALAGLLLASHLYILPSHPDPIIQGFLFVTAYAAWLAFFEKRVAIDLRVRTLIYYFLFAALGSARFLFPIFDVVRSGEITVFGHHEGTFLHTFHSFLGLPICQDFINSPIIWLSIPAIFWIPKMFRDKQRRVDAGFFLAVFLFGLTMIVPGQNSLFSFLMTTFTKHGYSMIFPARALSYALLGFLVVLLFGIDCIKKAKNVSIVDLFPLLALLCLPRMFEKNRLDAFDLLACACALIPFLMREVSRRHWSKSVSLLTVLTLTLVNGRNFFPSPKFTHDPANCKPYITLQSLLLNFQGSLKDGASLNFLQERLVTYEEERGAVGTIRFPEPYQAMLAKYGVNSAKNLSPNQVEGAVRDVFRTVDSYHLSQPRGHCPIFYPVATSSMHRATDFNHASLFLNIPDHNRRILIADGINSVMGPWGEGFFVHNSTILSDPRFTFAYPPLQALYWNPGEYYQQIGYYHSIPLSWGGGTRALTDPLVRKMFNLAGIDIFAWGNADFDAVPETLRKDLSAIPIDMPDEVRPPFRLFADNRSYGMAYLASKVHRVTPIADSLFSFKPPFEDETLQRAPRYKAIVDMQFENLMGLQKKHEIFLEVDEGFGIFDIPSGRNRMSIERILGNRAVFKVHCEAKPCELVFNYAALNGWRAYSDGVSLPVGRANFAFLATEAPLGDHLIWFELRKDSETLGTFVTFLGYLIGFSGGLLGAFPSRVRGRTRLRFRFPMPGLETEAARS